MASSIAAHGLVLWTDEQELVSSVGDYLEDGFRQDEAAIVVATPSHAYAISTEVAARRLDARRLLVMDASQLMDTIVVGGRVSATAADRVLRGALQLAEARGRGVRIYGEISDLLCACGNSPEAFNLERLANGLLQTVPLTILCGYPIAPFAGGARESCLAKIRSLHTHVLSDGPG